MHLPSSTDLRWEVRCALCDWQATLRAVIPYDAYEQAEARPGDRIGGFWEDYICPQHFTITRRTFRIVLPTLDLEEALVQYLTGQGSTTPVPRCPICHQAMVGGQMLNDLPFLLAPRIELQRWLRDKLYQLQRAVASERHAIAHGEQTVAVALVTLVAETQSLNTFYRSLSKQLGSTGHRAGILESTPDHLEEWQEQLEEAIAVAEHELGLLLKRKQDEDHKPPGRCPKCQNTSVHLVISATI
ncbi:MAG: hypothetical protein GYB66_02800 [Chloroflexi bacterium]|nr:hypothetical protein [Chloroflexota bacterium]